jgi:hypothetical protein
MLLTYQQAAEAWLYFTLLPSLNFIRSTYARSYWINDRRSTCKRAECSITSGRSDDDDDDDDDAESEECLTRRRVKQI